MKKNRIKVLVITGTMNLGGIENQLMHLLRNADLERFQIDFTTTVSDPYYKQEIESYGSKCIHIPEMKIYNPIPYCYRLYRIMKDGQYDIVHSHELFHSGIVLLVSHLAGVKGRICHAHNWKDGSSSEDKRTIIRRIYNHVMRKMICRYSTHQLACSTLAAKFLYGNNITEKDSFHLIFNSVDTHKFLNLDPSIVAKEFEEDWIKVLHVGRVTTVKNQLFLTEIAHIFKERKKKIQILCAGSGDADYIELVSNAISENNLHSHMTVLGPRDDICELMKIASAFVLPSHYEGMPLVVIEAQASGLPCVCADTFSHEVDFGLNRIQWLSLSDSPETWADAIEEAIKRGKGNINDSIRIIEKNGFDSSAFAQKLCALYTAAVKGAPV